MAHLESLIGDHPAYQRVALDRPPDWRFRRARWLADRGDAVRPSRHDDQDVVACCRFLRRLDRARTEDRQVKLFRDQPDLWLATELHDQAGICPQLSIALQGRILAAQDVGQIARLQNQHEQAVRRYEAVYFDVRTRLEARDWILNQVIVPALTAGNAVRTKNRLEAPESLGGGILTAQDPTVLLFCYLGGPAVADLFLGGLRRESISDPAAVTGWLDRSFKSLVRQNSLSFAVRADVMRWDAREVIDLHSRLVKAIDQVDGADGQEGIAETVAGILRATDMWSLAGESKRPGRRMPARVSASAREPGALELLELAGGAEPRRLLLEQRAEEVAGKLERKEPNRRRQNQTRRSGERESAHL